MTSKDIKFKYICKPFLIALGNFIVIYTLLNWFLRIKYELVILDNKIVELYLPLLISFIIVYCLLSPRLDLVKIKHPRDKSSYYLVFFLTIFLPVFMLQKYVDGSTHKLYKIDNVSQLEKNSYKKYYEVKNIVVDKDIVATKYVAEEKGWDNLTPKVNFYLVVPMYNTKEDNVSSNILFCGVFKKEIDDNLAGKQNEYTQLQEEIASQFKNTDFSKITYFTRINRASSNYLYFCDAAKKLDANISDWIFLSPQIKPFDEQNNTSFLFLSILFLVLGLSGIWVWTLVAYLNDDKVEKFLNKK